jgi:neutral ceramidase
MEIGIGKVCITPPRGTKLIGQPQQLESDGTYTDLFARSLYVQSNGVPIIIISCDLLFLSKDTMDYLRKEVSKSTSIPYEHIIIHTTHTHAGPSVTRLFNEKNVDPEVCGKIYDGIVSSGIHSFKTRRKGFIGFGKTYRDDLAYNRRYIMKDGSVELHPHKDDPNILYPEGPADHEINVLVVKDTRHVPVAAVANFSCHLTSLERNNTKISADFPFFAEKNLMHYFSNEDFVLLYLNGPCGNVCPVNVASKDTVEVGIEHTKKMGKRFSDAVLETIKRIETLDKDYTIRSQYREIKIPMRNITEQMIRDAENTLKECEGVVFKVKNLSNYGIESYKDKSVISANKLLETKFWKHAAAGELLKLNEKYKDDNRETVPLTVINLGPVLMITIPAELFVEFSLKLKKRFKYKYKAVFVAELVNGWVGYVPTKKAFVPEKGGYEVQFLNSSKLCKDAGDIIVKEIIEMERESAQSLK